MTFQFFTGCTVDLHLNREGAALLREKITRRVEEILK